MMAYARCLTVVFCFSSLFFSAAQAKTFEEKMYEYGIATGVLLPGKVYVSLHGEDVDRKANVFLKGFLDSYVVPKLAVGVYLNFSTLNLKEDIDIGFWGDDEDYKIEKSGISILELGGTLKPRFILSPRIAVKPGIGIGYRKFFGKTDFSSWQALGINGSCEVQYRINETVIIFEETGFLSQPVGGNIDTDITFGPTFYLLLGLAL